MKQQYEILDEAYEIWKTNHYMVDGDWDLIKRKLGEVDAKKYIDFWVDAPELHREGWIIRPARTYSVQFLQWYLTEELKKDC